jgi:hypothetical protein
MGSTTFAGGWLCHGVVAIRCRVDNSAKKGHQHFIRTLLAQRTGWKDPIQFVICRIVQCAVTMIRVPFGSWRASQVMQESCHMKL